MAKVTWVLAVDVGQKKTGLAVGQTLTQTARALTVLRQPVESLEAAIFAPWVKEWSVSAMVFGLPELRDGKPHPLRANIERLAAECRQVFDVPIYFVNEYLSSHEAAQRSPNRKDLDALAAAVIAEDWLATIGQVG